MNEDYYDDHYHHHDNHHPYSYSDTLQNHASDDILFGHAGALQDYDHIDPHHIDYSHFVGDPNDISVWHQQQRWDDCAVVGQQFLLEEITGQPHSETECVDIAQSNGGYVPDHGTYWDHIGDVLNAYGIPTENSFHNTSSDITNQLQQNHKVLVGVDATILSGQQQPPGQHTNHIVQVIGVDNSDPQHPKYVLNDPGTPNGQGIVVPAEKFYESWGAAGNWMMHTEGSSLAQPTPVVPPPSYAPSPMGYYNGDGTYHWSSDNTNRDPNNGTIVSWG